jgi:hypothetical protein
MNKHQSFPIKAGWLAAAMTTTLLSMPSAVKAQDLSSPCRELSKGDTVVIIEASNDERAQLVNQVVNQHNLQGSFCASRRTGRKVWMSSQLDNASTAVKVFDYFRNPSRPLMNISRIRL